MRKSRLGAFLLLTPQLLLSAVFLAGLAGGLLQSLGVVPAAGLRIPTLYYYQEVFLEESLLSSLLFSLWLSLVSSLLAAAGGVMLCAALVLSGRARGRTARLLQMPVVVPHAVVALFTVMLFSRSGIFSRLLYTTGWIPSQEAFPSLLYGRGGAGVIIAYLWKEIPFVAFFTVSLMAGISESFGEAARNLGASRWGAFRRVTLPLCLPAVGNAFLIVFAFSFGAYELPFLLGATMPKALPVRAYLEYTHPDLRNRPYAMALNGVMLLISLLAAVLYFRLMKKRLQWAEGGMGGAL